MKIVSTGDTLASPGFLEKKLKRRRKRRVIFLVAFVAFVIFLVIASRLESLRIQEITVSGASATSADSVIIIAKDQISGYYAWIAPRDNAFIYPKNQVREMLFRKFPRFSVVDLSVEGTKELKIRVVEREPFALYCEGGSSSCYFLDHTGFIFDSAPSFSEGVYFIYSNPENLENPLGTEYLPVEEFMALSAFVEKLPSLSLIPLSIEKTDGEFKVSLKSGAKLLWQRKAEPARIFSNLESFLMSPAILGEKDFLSRVAELDLRTEDKVFYRFRQ